VAWCLDDPHLTGHAFAHLVYKQALRFGSGITEDAIAALENANRRYITGELSLDAFFGSVTGNRSLGSCVNSSTVRPWRREHLSAD